MAYTRQNGGVRMDPGNSVFPVFSPDIDNQVSVASGVSSASQALPVDTRVFRVHADQACFLNFGGSGVTAASSDMPFDAGVEIMAVPEPNTHIAAIRNTTDGTVTITPMG